MVFSDGEDVRVVRAAARLLREGLIDPVLVGRPDRIRELLVEHAETGVAVRVVNPSVPRLLERNASDYMDIQKSRGKTISEADALRAAGSPLVAGALMVRRGEVEIGVAGNLSTTADVIRQGLRVLGTAPGIRTVSSVFYMLKGETTHVFSDCGVIPDPDSEQLVEIARNAVCAFRTVVGDVPRVAMLSFSTKGSANHPRVEKVRRAVELLRQRCPELIVDGELQYDAATVADVAHSKAPGSPVDGRANIFIFPSLEAGNIAYKIAQYLGGYTALGPMLQGFSRGWYDLSRGCSAEDIYEVAAVGLTMSRGDTK